jgi:hypothetical protein
MLAIGGAVLLLAAWRVLSSIRVDRLLALAPSAAPIALGATAIASTLATQRFLCTRRTLRSRHAVAVVPADEFDARPDAVLTVIAQLARSERRVAGWLDRRASALRVCLTNDPEGRLVYLLEVPQRSLELLRSALRGYHGVELRGAAEVLGEPEEEGGVVRRAELVLSRPSVEPLGRLGHDPDPLTPFAAAMAALRPGQGEGASLCLDLLPATGHRRARLRRVLRRQAQRQSGGRARSWTELLGGSERSGGSEPEELIERRLTGQALDAKLGEAGPLFEAQVLVYCRATERPRAKSAMGGLLAAFEPLAERNWLRVSGLPIPGVCFLGSDIALRRARFDHRLSSGLFRPARRSILTARELAGFLKPPTIHCRLDNVLRSGALLAPAPALPTFEADRKDLIPLGRLSSEAGDRIAAITVPDSFFSYIAGRSRYGKTELAIAQFIHVVRRGHGGLFLDPHGDALERIKPYLTEPALARRVVQIDLGPGSALASQPGWNLFGLKGASAEQSEARVEAVVDAFASALEWGERSNRAINLTTQAAGALAAIARVLAPEKAPTIFQIPTLLSNEEWRAAVLPFLPRASQGFWLDRFGRLAEEAITPLTNMVDRLRASTAASTLLGQSQSSYRAREAMDKGLIVLACPGSGGTRDRLLANLLVFDLFHAAMSRARGKRELFFACLDEIQTFDGGSSGNLAALIEQTAKFGLRGIFLNQNPERLSASTLNALTTNRSHLIASTLNSHAASLMSKEWGGEPSSSALSRLPRYRFIAQVTHKGELSRPFALGGIRVEDVLGAGKPGEVGALGRISEEVTARKSPAEALAHLEGLDGEILTELRQLRRGESADLSQASSAEPRAEAEGFEPVRVARRRS